MTTTQCAHPRCTSPAFYRWQPQGSPRMWHVCGDQRCRWQVKEQILADYPGAVIEETDLMPHVPEVF